MDEDELIMVEAQTDLIELLAKYPQHSLQALAMVLKTAVECYVFSLGEDGTVKILETAIDSVNDGKFAQNFPKIPKNQLN
tara:strand:- start:373 stop:612 length:240 start_codon:yes stop_codon:yes gene_type:complete